MTCSGAVSSADSKHPLTGRRQSPEHVAAKARKCEPGCVCGRHKLSAAAYEKLLVNTRAGVARAKADGVYKARKPRTAEDMPPEERRRRSEARKRAWAAGVYENARPATRRRVSNHEYKLAPYLAALGYRHNHDGHTFIGRKVPDFVDIPGRRVFEYFGGFWHQDPDEAGRIVDYYAGKGWSCTVLWEHDLFNWLARHRELVTEEQHQAAWKAAKVNNGYAKPPTHSTPV